MRMLIPIRKLSLIFTVMIACANFGCQPKSFIANPAGWKVIEIREDLTTSYDKAWQISVDTIARQWDIEILDKDSGYLRTAWKHGISNGPKDRYRGRVSLKFDTININNTQQLELKTEAEWFGRNRDDWYIPPLFLLFIDSEWVSGYDLKLQRDVYEALSGRLGRTVPQ